jgi:hypothetical protein
VGALHGRDPQMPNLPMNAFMIMRNVREGIYAYSFGRVAFWCGVLLLPPAEESVNPAHVVLGTVSLLLHAGAGCRWAGAEFGR